MRINILFLQLFLSLFLFFQESIAVDDNKICIDLIGASRMGIMSLLDDQVKHGSRASDTAWLRSMNYAFTFVSIFSFYCFRFSNCDSWTSIQLIEYGVNFNTILHFLEVH